MSTVIFDLDGTLLDTIKTIAYYGNKSLSKYGFETFPEDKYKYFVGNGAVLLIERALDAQGALTKENFDKVYPFYNNIYNADTLYLTEPYSGIKDMLRELKKDGIKTAVLSNKPHEAASDVVEKLLGKDLIDICCGGKDGVPLKPDPWGANEILKALSSDKEHSFFVGDTYVDMKTGINAGLCPIGVTWGFRPESELLEAGAKFIANNTDELIKIIRSNR